MKGLYLAILAWVTLVVLVSGCSGKEEKGGGIVNTGNQSWPNLFDRDNLSWFMYNMTNMTSDRIERQLTVSYSDSEIGFKFANGTKWSLPTVKTKIHMEWLDMDRIYGADIQDNKSDGNPVSLIIFMGNKSVAHSIAPLSPMDSAASMANNSWLIFARSCDLAARSDVKNNSNLHVSGFDFLTYNNSIYYCSVYESYEDPVFRAWHNDSMPVPLKILENFNATRTDVPEVWTFELVGWG